MLSEFGEEEAVDLEEGAAGNPEGEAVGSRLGGSRFEGVRRCS